ncbi:LysM peptidoglycan-binding domain-containing protein [Gemella palaticanis]|uniref:LysM peptidoglycan-binding domain-containing protein n=2 Tax=Gemelliphila palaticanis TaxID=81950 RepID=A0ABX2T065_9BACL|nr:LysM peptidoglycan-binding domain-containing protein [Gemella palaticanis]NYS46769.1 LysM peptidoglycan-binding domain-containing protein [Gemella palaticanis]
MSAVAIGFTTLADADIYTVKSGDTLWDIALNNGTTVEQLMKDNNLTSDLIFPGDQLSFQNTAAQVVTAQNNGTYRVVLGDTLFKIANKFGTTVDSLVNLNKISNPNLILVGQELVINEVAKSNTVETSPVVVKKEEVSLLPKVETKSVVETKKEEVAPAPVVETKKEEVASAPVVETKKEEVAPAPVVETKKEEEAPAPVVETKKEEVAPVVVPVSTPVGNKGAAIFAAAQAQLGVFQDCTMLVTNALKSVGINFHDWPAGYMSLGTVISESEAQPGDLVYYANGGMGFAHIAVYAGNGQAIHGGWFGNQTALNTVYVGSGPVFIRVR